MNVKIKQGSTLRYLAMALLAVGTLYAGFVLSSESAQAYEIMYSYNADHSNAQPLDGATITDDMYVFVIDPDPEDIGEAWFSKGGWWNNRDVDRDSTYKSFDYGDNTDSSGNPDGDANTPMYFEKAGWANDPSRPQVHRVSLQGTNEPELWAEYSVPYGETYYGRSYGGFNITSISGYTLGGTVGSNSGMDWLIERRNSITNNISLSFDDPIDFEGEKDQLKGLLRAYEHTRLVAYGSYTEGGVVKPVLKNFDRYWGTDKGEVRDPWGAGVPGSVNAGVVGLSDLNDTTSGTPAERVWFAGYKMIGPDPYWEIGKLIVNGSSINLVTTGNWDLQATSSLTYGSGPIKGEAMAMTKDLSYIYTGGYVKDGSGNPYWRIEKRERGSGKLVDDLELPAVGGKILAMRIQITQGSDAVWAAGYKTVGGVNQWHFQKFDTNLNPVPGATRTWNEGSIKAIELHGLDNVYFGGENLNGGNNELRVERFDRNGNPQDTLLSEDLSNTGNPSTQDSFSAMQLPLVVGVNGDTGAGFVRGVKLSGGGNYCQPPGIAANRYDRIIIDHHGRGGLNTYNGRVLDNPDDPMSILSGMEFPTTQSPAIPAGKYDVISIVQDGGHSQHVNEYEQTQDHEFIVSYFFGSSTPGDTSPFAKTNPTLADDLPSDWLYKAYQETGLQIPFDVYSTTLAHYVYDQSPGPWYNKTSPISFPGVEWRGGGSVGAVCTVLDRYPQCNDGIDNDGDGLIDHAGGPSGEALDDGCDDANDDSEDNDLIDCSLTVPVGGYLVEYTSLDPVTNKYSIISDTTIDRARLTPKPLAIAAGNYKVTLEYYDPSHPLGTTQTREQWKVQLLDGSNPDTSTVLAESGVTPDLPDATVRDVSVVNSSLVVPSGVTHIMPVNDAYPSYASDGIGDTTDTHSLRPRCAAFEPVAAPPPGTCSLVQGLDRAAGEYELVVPIRENDSGDGWVGTDFGTGVTDTITTDKNGQPFSIGEGLYEITLQSWEDQDPSSEPLERWQAVFANSTSGVVDTSSTTNDLPDRIVPEVQVTIQTNSWSSKNGPPLEIPAGVTVDEIWGEHPDFPNPGGNSINAVCVGINPVPVCPYEEGVTHDIVVDFSPSSWVYGESAKNVLYGNNLATPGGNAEHRDNPFLKDIPIGRYDVSMFSYDGYPDRDTDGSPPHEGEDPNEMWKVALHIKDESPNNNLYSLATPDLTDYVKYTEQDYDFPTPLDIAFEIDKVKAIHGYDKTSVPPIWEDYRGSVRVQCVGFTDTGLPSDNECKLLTTLYDYVIPIDNSRIGSGGRVVSATTSVPGGEIPAGVYDVTLQTYDAHDGSPTGQDKEQWRAKFIYEDPLEDGGYKESSASDDLPDIETYNLTTVDTFFKIATTTHLQAVHDVYTGVAPSYSLSAVCVGLNAVEMPDLDVTSGGTVAPVNELTDWYRETGFYYDVDLSNLRVTNIGDAATDLNDPGPFDITLDSRFRIPPPPPYTTYPERTFIKTFRPGILGIGGVFSRTDVILTDTPSYIPPGVPPGDWEVVITADSNKTIDPIYGEVTEFDENNNTMTISGSGDDRIFAPDPGITLDINPGFVRVGDTANIDWNTKATYPMNCSVSGQGATVVTFDPSQPETAANPVNNGIGTVESGPVMAKSEFVLRCQEQISGYGDWFTDTAIVETVGQVQEN